MGWAAALAAGLAGFLDMFGHRRVRQLSDAWHHAIGNLFLLALQSFNLYWRYEHGPEGVLPIGLACSVVAVGLMGYTGWMGGELVYRHRVGVRDQEHEPQGSSYAQSTIVPHVSPDSRRTAVGARDGAFRGE